MLNNIEIKRIIDKIISSDYYEGDFGDLIEDSALLTDGLDEKDKNSLPEDYIEFMATYGFGELDAAFYLDDAPKSYCSIVGEYLPVYSGKYVFSGNSSEIFFAFDSLRKWQVVAISSESDDICVVANSFSDFILEKLKYVESLVDWRDNT